jgi:hypothetical protein
MPFWPSECCDARSVGAVLVWHLRGLELKSVFASDLFALVRKVVGLDGITPSSMPSCEEPLVVDTK